MDVVQHQVLDHVHVGVAAVEGPEALRAWRLRQFEASLRSDLGASGKIRTVTLDCPANACSVGDIDAPQLIGVLMTGMGAGLTWGSGLIEWTDGGRG